MLSLSLSLRSWNLIHPQTSCRIKVLGSRPCLRHTSTVSVQNFIIIIKFYRNIVQLTRHFTWLLSFIGLVNMPQPLSSCQALYWSNCTWWRQIALHMGPKLTFLFPHVWHKVTSTQGNTALPGWIFFSKLKAILKYFKYSWKLYWVNLKVDQLTTIFN